MEKKQASAGDENLELRFVKDNNADADTDDNDDNIPECFRCCVCLDLLYKPIVLACGHISCFWCVHKAMSSFHQSHCPICRQPYNHFPGICEVLHFLLLKVEPVAYKRREMQVLEEEKKADCFSPQIDDQSTTNLALTSNGSDRPVCSYCSSEQHSHVHLCSPNKCNFGDADCSSLSDDHKSDFQAKSHPTNSGTNTNEGLEENYLENDLFRGKCDISVSDARCVACKQMLFRPVVLNCGHAYCESCIDNPVHGSLRCQVCDSLHPGGLPKVCLALDNFVEDKLPTEYAFRKQAHQLKQSCCQRDGPSSCATQSGGKNAKSSPSMDPSWWVEHGSNVHIGVGCDSCGMCPLIGERYKCTDCVEQIGFDLCGDCYRTRSKLPGRFNQKHTPDHKFKLIPRSTFHNLVMRFAAEENGSPTEEDEASLEDAGERDSTT